MKKIHLLLFLFVPFFCAAQNVGIGTTTPAGKLHIKGSADSSQLTIDANVTQTNKHPLIRLRNSAGADLLHINSDEPNNVFIGLNAGISNNSLGGGLYNTFIGTQSGFSNSTGSSNTGVGREALIYNTTGKQNTAIGTNALYSNTIGINNNANGFSALYSNTTGSNNSALGTQALYFNTIGISNIANGYNALFKNTSGFRNIAVGEEALRSNTTGGDNVAIGAQALFSNTTGIINVAMGYQALYSNITGGSNTAIGWFSLSNNTTGGDNTAIGVASLINNNTGSANTAFGDGALENVSTGSSNTAIGFLSGTATGSPNIQNTVSIGNSGYLNAANNQAFIGNLSTIWIGGNEPWSTFSDARIKTNITENVKGLDFIMKLRPVTYYKSMDAITQLTGNKETPDCASKHDADKILQSGFLAQEVEQAATSVNYDFSGLHVPANSKQLYSLSYSEFVVPLVKAMQEQQKMISDLQALIKTQQAEIDILKQKVK